MKKWMGVAAVLAVSVVAAAAFAEEKISVDTQGKTVTSNTAPDEDAATASKQKFAEPEAEFTEAADIPRYVEPFKFKFKDEASLQFYGRLEMLTYLDSTIPFLSDWLLYVQPSDTYNGSHASYSMSVRGSPFGFVFSIPKLTKRIALSGKLEMDFSGGFTTGTMSVYSPLVRLKQAYFSLDGKHLSFLFGQTFALFSPLFPDIASWIALGTSGNPWIRLPQIKFTAKYNPMIVEVAITRPMAANVTFGNQLDDIISDGEQSKLPFFMGRVGYNGDFEKIDISTGVSGVYGREKIYRNDSATATYVNKTIPTWLVGYDLKLVTKYIDFLGEIYIGDNLNQFFAGVLQGVNTTTSNAWAIRDIGGWGQVTIKPTKTWYFNVGAGLDNPFNRDLTAAGRSSNLTVYGNANYMLAKWVRFSLEPSYTRTGYMNGTTNKNWRGLFKTAFTF